MSLKKYLYLFAISLLIVFAAGLYVHLNTARIVVFHTNDIHGWIMPHVDKEPAKEEKSIKGGIKKPSPEKITGGAAALANYLKKFPRGYLLINSGDFLSGTPEVDLSKGDAAIDCMNALGYNASALGNHDFDFGKENVERMSRMAKFTFIAANVFDAQKGELVPCVEPFIEKDVDGVKVAVIGLTTSKMASLTKQKNVDGLYFQRETDALRRMMLLMKERGVQVVIVAAHVGFEPKDAPLNVEGEKFLASAVPGIHLILGGHTHAGFEKAYQSGAGKTIIVHNQSEFRTVTKTVLRVWKKSGKLFSYSYELVPLDVGKYGEDTEVKRIVKAYQKKISDELDIVIGNSKMLLDRKGYETLLGNWQTDILRWYSRSDVAFQNEGAMRADIPEGLLTFRNFYLVSPFEDDIVTMDLTGRQIKDILEYSVSGAPGMMQFSGLKVIYNLERPKNKKVVEVTVVDKTKESILDLRKTYKVGTNDFLGEGGDGFVWFREGKNVKDTGVPFRKLEIEFVKKFSPISTKLDGRIVVK